MKKWSIAALAAAAVVFGAAASNAATKDLLKFGVTNFADSLEPTDNYFGWVVTRYGIGECLSKFDEKMNTVPCLAKSWELSEDKLTWTFTIDERACFSNGNKLTGELAAASIRRTFEKAPRARSYVEVTEVKGEGDKVIVTTTKPIPTLPGIFGDPLFIIIDTTVTDRDYAKEGPICTGPYMVTSYSKALAKLDANPYYWAGSVPFAHVEIPTIDDPNTRAMALQAGEVDMIINVSAGDLDLFKDPSKFTISTIASLRSVIARVNQAPGRLLSDAAVRHALIRSLDRDTYADVLLKGTFIAGGPQIPPSMDYGFDTLDNPDKYDPDSAEELLEKAGWKMGKDGVREKDGKKLELDFVFYSGRAELPLAAEATQADAASVGFKVNLKNVDYNVTDGMGIRGEYDLLISNVLAAQAGDPEVYMNMYWKTNKYDKDPAQGTNPQNGSGYSNPEYDALSEALSTEFDPAKRREIVMKMQQIVLDEAATVVFFYPQTNMVSNVTVKDANIQPCDYYWLTADIKPAQ